METESDIRERKAVEVFADVIREEVGRFLDDMDPDCFAHAAALIRRSEAVGGRLHITGIGKPGHIAGYAASLISSTGTPAYFLHGTEAVHGSCGQLREGDVVICISNSGETSELKATAMAVRNNGCGIIAVTSDPGSWLARYADVHICAPVSREGGSLNRAPRASILVETLVLQGLSVVLQEAKGLTPQQYVKRHPGGALGALREGEA